MTGQFLNSNVTHTNDPEGKCDNSAILSHETHDTAKIVKRILNCPKSSKSTFSGSKSGSGLKPTSKHNPCPICEDGSGDCRQGRTDPDFWLCMTYADSRKGDIVGAYKCIGTTKNGQWGQFKPDNSHEWTEEKRREWETENQRRSAEKARQIEEAKKKSLSDADRHENYSKLFAELKDSNGLKPEHKADLIRRGLSAVQIELIGAVSFVGFQKLQREYSELLPGIALGGKSISVGGEGYIFPIRNAQGQILGAQIRAIGIPDQVEPNQETSKQPKYKWLSGGKGTLQQFPSQHKESGELPLAVHYPSEVKSLAIGLCEGTGVKPFLAAQRLGIPFIGASGGQHASSPALLKKYLREIHNWLWSRLNPPIGQKAPLLSDVTRCNIQIYPDGGCLKNPQVMRQLEATLHLLRDESPIVAWWEQFDKESGDIDQIDPSTPITFLRDCEFLELAAALSQENPTCEPTPEDEQKVTFQSPPEDEQKVTFQNDLLSLNYREHSADSQKLKEKPAWIKEAKAIWAQRRKFTAQVTLNTQDGWFEYPLPLEGLMLFARSGLGTGKTTQLKKWVAELPDEGWIVLGYRNTLLLQFCNAVKGFEHLHEHNGKARIADKYSKLALCVDSLNHFTPEDFDGKNLVLDEVMSVVRHLHTSSTIKYPDKIQYLFSEAIKRCKRVICLDGLLADWAVDYLKATDQTKEVITVNNVSKREKAPINLLLGTELEEKIKTFDRSPWLKMILEEARLPAICSDSQIFCEALDNLLTGQGLNVLRLDSKTVSEKYAKEFLSNCDAYIEQNKPDVVLYSPTAESGLDISIQNYFTHHFCFFYGVLGVDSIIQMMGRIRDTIPKFLWCQEWSTTNDIGINSPHELVVMRAKKSLFAADAIEVMEAAIEGGIEKAAESLKAMQKLLKDNLDENFRAACTLSAINNFERSNLRDCLTDALKAEGYQVKICIGDNDAAIAARVKAEAKTVRESNCLEIFNAEMIPLDEARENSYDASWEERVKTIQAVYRRRLPGIETTPVWSPDFINLIRYKDRNFINASELRWLLKNPEVALRQQQKMWSDKLYYQPERISLIRLRSRRAIIEALRELEIEQFLIEGSTWHQDCKEFKDTLEMGKQKDIIAALGINPGKMAAAQYIGKLLALLGYQWGSERKQENGKETRTYFVKDSEAPTRAIVLECISRKWGNYLEESEKLYWEPDTTEAEEITPDEPLESITETEAEEITPEEPLEHSITEADMTEEITPDEPLEPSITEADIGELFELQSFEGTFGSLTNEPHVIWLSDHKLMELPKEHCEYYIFEAPSGKRIVAFEGSFRPQPKVNTSILDFEDEEEFPDFFPTFALS